MRKARCTSYMLQYVSNISFGQLQNFSDNFVPNGSQSGVEFLHFSLIGCDMTSIALVFEIMRVSRSSHTTFVRVTADLDCQSHEKC